MQGNIEKMDNILEAREATLFRAWNMSGELHAALQEADLATQIGWLEMIDKAIVIELSRNFEVKISATK